MDFEFDDDQRLLKETVDRLVADLYGFDDRRRYLEGEHGFSPAMWRTFSELGLAGLSVAEEHGGSGKSAIETMIVMEAFGRALVVEPVLAAAVIGAHALGRFGSPAQRARFLPDLATGARLTALAVTERHSGFDLHDVETVAVADASSVTLTGRKSVVLHGAAADTLIVSARAAGARRDMAGVGLYLVDGRAEGVTRRPYRLQDGSPAAEIGLERVRVAPEDELVGPEGGLAALASIEAVAIAALAAEAVGVMAEMQAMTVDYLKTRKQFGVAIGSFQALQHRAAEMFVALEQARSMAMLAAVACEDPDPTARDRAVSAAKVQVCRSGRFIGQSAVQLHGGIGMTMEYKVGHLFKRMTMIETLFGDLDHHLDRMVDLGGLPDAA